jgi:hypothetical protein
VFAEQIARTGRWGSEAQATHRREGEAGYNVSLEGTMGDTQKSQTISTENQGIASQVAWNSKRRSTERVTDKPPLLAGGSTLTRIRLLAEADRDLTFRSLAHRIDVSLLRESFRQLHKNESTGVDKVTAKQYAENLVENLYNLHQRLSRGQYVASPVKRIWLDKEDGKKRPIGITFYWGKSLEGNWGIKKQTARKRRNRFMRMLWSWCKDSRHDPISLQHAMLCSKLRGFYQYFGVRGNYKVLEVVYEYAQRAWKHWLGRRHRDGRISHEKFRRTLKAYPLPRPRIVHNI